MSAVEADDLEQMMLNARQYEKTIRKQAQEGAQRG